MRSRKQSWCQLFLKLTVALGLLWTLFLVLEMQSSWPIDLTHRNHWLDYRDYDFGPETLCNCSGLLEGNTEALVEAKLLTITKEFQKHIHIPDEYYINETKDCRNFKSKRKYITFALSKEEEDFPLAYSIVVHHKVQNFERLLRAIYAPQNIYCIHVDEKSQASVKAAITGIVSCFPNVFMVTHAVNVVYAGWPRVQADINCMADLYKYSTEWKYFINLCGQDFPLKTNLEMVRMLRSLKGGNSMESEDMPGSKKWRISQVHQIVNGAIKSTGKSKSPPPFNFPIKSGNAYIVVTRGYIRSVLKDTRVQDLIEWAKDTYSPDEFLWATIQRIPGVPGSKRPHTKYDQTDMNAIARLVKWFSHEGSQDSAVYPACQGSHVRSTCVYGVGDLQWLLENHHLFANKFDMDTNPIPVFCLERHLRQKALAETEGQFFF
ncbi:beta-1,3-galactosyl-O-glycosyl-glycoprotein beta-1,6-N-acetylglucosaminyltransferase-like [Poeciliopsis prolifica]|uniref:beta-1,3-galactosyl-O-glycosyl-glycoprotein beta-1,6-N-acetylglucosaminyltransferase-like n=1 Tax=Poeciliopsis prolifica TaxID=188132 RepID=UPI0024138419|nr:beta-1,3-galactosyl-O-glycosyl-glycoprotein beta-1,6-N-acetylglucosaminyltransferase-like [Poeciliopsis prolifica]XP_054905144.1 beta-1,3-galactosyl-O-glycosyl-glycoprotein beta-1,6-N-acetylglucosaminyltransferase-like [Poeciliopsis prolifica]XP_054905145.1 beta-1,3-galactosyl-O-glycosyl-glycoprotein beta-1,6-N-acetylglucosaminyltransferase-like [Poeciliopsis prolifica]XP_054905147.1 beta-1,3-galactosyl-O-glycosyl-glycoprotein beta-1,6-N-acetylglucosaminyltransferase-like [Poeciliopsis prolif